MEENYNNQLLHAKWVIIRTAYCAGRLKNRILDYIGWWDLRIQRLNHLECWSPKDLTGEWLLEWKCNKLRISLNESWSKPEFQQFFSTAIICLHPQSKSQPHVTRLPGKEKEKWIRVSYLGRSSELLARELRGYMSGLYPDTRILDLCDLKDPTPPNEKSGIYSLKCTCGSEYIG